MRVAAGLHRDGHVLLAAGGQRDIAARVAPSGGEPVPGRDLAAESHAAVATYADGLLPSLTDAPPATLAGLVAVLASVAADVPRSAAVRPLEQELCERVVGRALA